MNEKEIGFIHHHRTMTLSETDQLLGKDQASLVRDYHAGFPGYEKTPLSVLPTLAEELGVGGIYVKDESHRFGLNAFKALGGSYAIGRYLADRLGLDSVDFEKIASAESKKKLGDITFATTTDGNHGRGVAYTANVLGFRSVIFMPKGTKAERIQNIEKAGGIVTVLPMNYDDCVRYTKEQAEQNGWVLMQDTSWPGYEDFPTWILQGYMTMASEAEEQMTSMGLKKPTHLFLQAGVGSMPASVLGYFVNAYGPAGCPKTIIVESNQADCFFQTAKAKDGSLHAVGGEMDTIMAGLACGECNPMAWKILNAHADAFASCPDFVSARGMRILGNPLGNDPRVISGESGAVGIGLLSILLTNPLYQKEKEDLALTENSVVLCFSTEGDTDQEGYRAVVWEGLCPS